MKSIDWLLIAAVLLCFSPCAVEIARCSPGMNWKSVQGKVISTDVNQYFGRRRGFSAVTVLYEYRTNDGIMRQNSASSWLHWTGCDDLNTPFVPGGDIVVQFDPTSSGSSVCSELGLAFAGLHLLDGFFGSVVACILLVIKGMAGKNEMQAQRAYR